ncbi:winged helix DNA-binding domain-containing protein [bacterium]|nr:winged helix DNA-binding domain-containing protein [bacterium]
MGTANDLTGNRRLNRLAALPFIVELVEDGQLVATSFTGWAAPILLHPDASPPRLAQALPRLFDPEARNRDRAERRFDFRYRLEIYVPLAKRVFGDYVLPLRSVAISSPGSASRQIARPDVCLSEVSSASVASLHTRRLQNFLAYSTKWWLGWSSAPGLRWWQTVTSCRHYAPHDRFLRHSDGL